MELQRAWVPLGPRLPFVWQAQYTEPLGPFVWQAQYTEPPGGVAVRVGAAGAATAFCTQSLLEELRCAWAPLGPRLPFVWQAQYTEPPGGAAAAFCVAGAVHRAF